MSFGIASFRIDAAAHMVDRPLDPAGGKDKDHTVLRDIFRHVTDCIPDALIMSEVNEDEGSLSDFFDGGQMNAMLVGDGPRLCLAFSLLFAIPGAPLICYGDEIGMGEDLSQKGRNAVRSPMQWTKGRNGGFSTAPRRN
jgi:glycosidase